MYQRFSSSSLYSSRSLTILSICTSSSFCFSLVCVVLFFEYIGYLVSFVVGRLVFVEYYISY